MSDATPISDQTPATSHPLEGVRVLETGDSTIDFCGLLLAGLGAQVIKVEPPGGSEGRTFGPFTPRLDGHEASLFFSTYNRGKESVVLDESNPRDRERLESLVAQADIWIDAGTPGEYRPFFGFDLAELEENFPQLITASLTPFGETGPWSSYKGGDLVQLALGGVLMNCGYDPSPNGEYDMAPIWPQAFHSLAIAGEQLSIGILAALYWRSHSGRGQALSCAIHEAVAKCTEVDLMAWVMFAHAVSSSNVAPFRTGADRAHDCSDQRRALAQRHDLGRGRSDEVAQLLGRRRHRRRCRRER